MHRRNCKDWFGIGIGYDRSLSSCGLGRYPYPGTVLVSTSTKDSSEFIFKCSRGGVVGAGWCECGPFDPTTDAHDPFGIDYAHDYENRYESINVFPQCRERLTRDHFPRIFLIQPLI